MNPRLAVLSEGSEARIIPLNLDEGGSFTCGRVSECDLLLKDDSSISRRHCRIVREGDNFLVEDLKSHNGTYLNDAPVEKQILSHGDRIRIGNSYFMILIEESDALLNQASFDDGTLVTNSAIRLSPHADTAVFPPDLDVLIKIGKAVNELQTSESLQARILEIILEFIPARRGAILLTDEDLSDAKVICVSAKQNFDLEPMQISRTVSKQVLREQTALLSNDLSDKKLDKAESLIASRVSSLLCVPFRSSESKGLIYLDSSDPVARFTETHLEQMTALSFLISAALENVTSIEHLRRENKILKDSLNIETNMIGESPVLKEVMRLISKVAPADSTVLITGESGTGKELVARAIHYNSPRSEKTYAAINCSAITETLLESELFGFEKGSFTGAISQRKGKLETADGGTIFLDEVGDMSPAMQVKLLRVLQEREFERVGGTNTVKVNVRVIAATHRNLEEEIKAGRFRSDLFFRLNVVQIKVPPLRERKSDIEILAQHFVEKYSKHCNRKVVGISAKARKILVDYDWHGNVRELENVIERAIVLGSTDRILHEDLPSELIENSASLISDFKGDLHEQMKQAKRKIVLDAISAAGGNYTEAARTLGVHPNNLHRVMRDLGLKNGK